MTMNHEYTNRLIDAIDDGILGKDRLILACLKWMGEDNVKRMCEANKFFMEDEDEFDPTGIVNE